MNIKKIFFWLLIFVVFFNGCNNSTIVNKTNKISVSIAETDIHKADIYYFVNGNFSKDSVNDSAMIVIDAQSNAYIVIKSNNSTYTLCMQEVERQPFNTGELMCADIDNDGIDELLFWGEVNGNGYTIAGIFKLVDNEIKQIVDLNQRKDISYNYINNKKLLIDAKKYDFSKTIDISNEFDNADFDYAGLYTGSSDVIELSVDDIDIYTVDDSENNIKIYFSYGIKINSFLGRIKISLNYEEESAQYVVYDINFQNKIG